jgi:hypothetical protein
MSNYDNSNRGGKMIKTIVILMIITLLLPAGCSQTREQELQPSASFTPPAISPETGAASASASPTSEPIQTTETPTTPSRELLALLWDTLPDSLPQGYKKTDLHPETGNATYIGEGKWGYSISGNVSRSSSLSPEYVERAPDDWIQVRSNKVVTDDLLLQAEYFETTGALNILRIEKTGETETRKIISEVPITANKLKVNWISGYTMGYGFRVEGSVKNVGILPLENILFEVNYYDTGGKLITTDNITISPAEINIGESCKFVLDVDGFYVHGSDPKEGKVNFGFFKYRFLMPSGKQILTEPPD